MSYFEKAGQKRNKSILLQTTCNFSQFCMLCA